MDRPVPDPDGTRSRGRDVTGHPGRFGERLYYRSEAGASRISYRQRQEDWVGRTAVNDRGGPSLSAPLPDLTVP